MDIVVAKVKWPGVFPHMELIFVIKPAVGCYFFMLK